MLTLGKWNEIKVIDRNGSKLLRVECPECEFRITFNRTDALTQNKLYRYCPMCGEWMNVQDI